MKKIDQGRLDLQSNAFALPYSRVSLSGQDWLSPHMTGLAWPSPGVLEMIALYLVRGSRSDLYFRFFLNGGISGCDLYSGATYTLASQYLGCSQN